MQQSRENRQTRPRSSRASSFRDATSIRSRSKSSDYVFGSAAPAIEPETRPWIDPKTKRGNRQVRENKKQNRRAFKVIHSPKAAPKDVSAQLPSVARAFSLAIILFAIVGVISITLSSMAVGMSVQQQNLQTQISQAREEGKALEVQYGALSNPTQVKEKAGALGMAAASDSLQIDLGDDCVKKDSDGKILLATTINSIN